MPLIHLGDDGRTWLEADNVMSEAYGYSRQVTNHPVGKRSLPADHRIKEPATLDLVLRVTESPLAAGTAEAPGAINPLIFVESNGEKVADSAIPGRIFSDLTRPRSATFATALRLYEEGLFEYLSVSMGLMKNLVLVSWTYEIRTPVHVDFNLSLQEIEFIAAQRVELPPLVVLKKAPETCPTVQTGDKAKGVVAGGGTGDGTFGGINPRDASLLQKLAEANAGGPEKLAEWITSFAISP